MASPRWRLKRNHRGFVIPIDIMEKSTGKYIYCIIRKPESFDLDFCGVAGSRIHCVESKKLSVVVSDAEMKDYPITRENTVTHQRVIEEVMRLYSPVLPVSFGTVAENGIVIKEKILESKQDELLDALRDIEGKVELNLKAMWLDMPKILQKIVAENPELSRMKRALSGKMLGRDEAIEVGQLVASGIEARKGRIREEILAMLEDIIVDKKDTPLLGDQMIFNLALLIPENKQRTFDKIVCNLDEKYEEEGAYFKYIGPSPAFNFIKVPISLS